MSLKVSKMSEWFSHHWGELALKFGLRGGVVDTWISQSVVQSKIRESGPQVWGCVWTWLGVQNPCQYQVNSQWFSLTWTSLEVNGKLSGTHREWGTTRWRRKFNISQYQMLTRKENVCYATKSLQEKQRLKVVFVGEESLFSTLFHPILSSSVSVGGGDVWCDWV